MNPASSGESVVFRLIGRVQVNQLCSGEISFFHLNELSSGESVVFR